MAPAREVDFLVIAGMCWLAEASAVHPLSALVPEQQEAFDAAVVAGLVLYLVALTLRSRALQHSAPLEPDTRQPTLEEVPLGS